MNLDRVHEDLAAGRPWKALDRLQGMRSRAPAGQVVIKPRAPVDALPPGARARLRELQTQLDAVGVRWEPGARRERSAIVWTQPSTRQSVAGVAGCHGLASVAVVPWLRGILAFFE